MNYLKLQNIFDLYKQNSQAIYSKEIYKWEAVKCFQENWDIDAPDFEGMIERSFRLTKNLLDSGKYFPKRMVLQYATKRPEQMRLVFQSLFDENVDILERVNDFMTSVGKIHREIFSDKLSYQDLRAIIVYLCLRYPDRYFLYKFEMFKTFVNTVDYPYSPRRGKLENIAQYMTLCNLVREHIKNDNDLISLHRKAISFEKYFDATFNILTQNIIYAAVRHIKDTDISPPVHVNIEVVESDLRPEEVEIELKGIFVNFLDNERENKRIGDLGELVILELEKGKLLSYGFYDLQPEHVSKNWGDGLGYDILSYDSARNAIYIEVKTTKSKLITPFFLTQSELIKSIRETSNYFLYRLFNFDEHSKSGKVWIKNGDLTSLCNNPVLFKTTLTYLS